VTDGTFGWHLGTLVRAHSSLLLAALGDFPHGPRGYQTMATVVEGEHPNQIALASYLGIDRTVMTYLLDDLVKAGLVERQQNPADRRQRRVVATDQGRRTFADLERRVCQAEDRLLRALAPDEREAFRQLLRRVACDVRDIDTETDLCTSVEHLLNQG
jgi:MarR family transcriptional regulator for hemolysin